MCSSCEGPRLCYYIDLLVPRSWMHASPAASQPGANRGFDCKAVNERCNKTVSKERKAELTAQFGNTPVDTGNPKVQVAILSERIKELTEHMKSHQKDFHTRRGLLMLVGRRRRLLSYIKKNDVFEYRALIKELGIRDNIQ